MKKISRLVVHRCPKCFGILEVGGAPVQSQYIAKCQECGALVGKVIVRYPDADEIDWESMKQG